MIYMFLKDLLKCYIHNADMKITIMKDFKEILTVSHKNELNNNNLLNKKVKGFFIVQNTLKIDIEEW